MEITENREIIQKLLSHHVSFALNSIELTHPKIECKKIINEDIVLILCTWMLARNRSLSVLLIKYAENNHLHSWNYLF